MRKIFSARHNALFSSTELSWGAYALMFSGFLLLVRLLAPDFFWHTCTPVFQSADYLTAETQRFFASFSDTASLALANENLLEQNNALVNENQALTQKAASLEALLGSAPGETVKRAGEILAGVVARPPESPYDVLVLAEGSQAGITVGQEAFGASGVPIGVVSSVTADFSQVTLFSSWGMNVQGWVGSAALPLTIRGVGGGSLIASVPRAANIAAGDSVSVPGPGALPIGKVVRVDSDPSSPSVVLRIMPILNPFSITWVVLRSSGAILGNTLRSATATEL